MSARNPTIANGAVAMKIRRPTWFGTGSGCDRAHPHSHAATVNAGATGHQSASHSARSRRRAADALARRAGRHSANNCSDSPPSRMISVARRDSRSTLGFPMSSDCLLEHRQQIRIDGIDSIDE